MKKKIKSICVTNGNAEPILFRVGWNSVLEIEDNSQEFPDSTEWVFDIFGADRKLLSRIINCKVVINYE